MNATAVWKKTDASLGRLLVTGTNWAGSKRAHLTLREARVDGAVTPYYEGGRGAPLVLVHGLSDDKSSFLRTAAGLSSSRRVILPDLRAHGDSTFGADANMAIDGHVEWLARFLDACHCPKVDLGGNSMGGHISLAFALRHPDRVRRLILLNAPGAAVDAASIYVGYPEPVHTVDDLMKIMKRVFYRIPRMPGPVARHLVREIGQRRETVNAIARTVREGPMSRLDDELPRIACPTLVLWGVHDVTVPLAVANLYRERIPNCRYVELDAGHSPQLEIPDAVARAIADFVGID